MAPILKSEYKYNIGDKFTDDRDIEIIDRKIIVKDTVRKGKPFQINVKMYRIKCNICGWDNNWIRQIQLERKKQKYHCSCCNHSIVVTGINDIATTHPHKIKYFENANDAMNNVYGSTKKVFFKCPICGDVRLRSIVNVIKEEKYSCKKCGDGFSIPERFMYNILQYCNVDFIHQLSKTTFGWCDKYFYDFYLPKVNMIIEVDGIQHYISKFGGDVEQQMQTDIYKEYLAKNNGIKYYEIIPAIYTNFEYLKDVLMGHELFKVLGIDTTQIDFEMCYKNTCSSLIKQVCEDYNNNSDQKIIDLAIKYHVSRPTIRDYLKKGNLFGWCKFSKDDMKEHKNSIVRNIGYNNAKPVEVFKDGKSLGVFKSATELQNKSLTLFGVQFIESKINAVCRGVYKSHIGYNFKRLTKEEYSMRTNNLSID